MVPILRGVTLALAMAWSLPAAEPEAVPTPPAAAEGRLDTPQAKTAYAVGLRIGSRIAADFQRDHADLTPAALARGIADAIRGATPALPEAEIATVLEQFDEAMRKRGEQFAKRMEEAARTNSVKAREFLQTNATKPGIVVLPSGLQYEVLRAGSGDRPTIDDVVATHYRGTHLDGGEFDATDPGAEPATFPVRGVVPGWQEALPLMKVGAKWRLFVPPELGYGAEGSPPVIGPNELLVFEIELVRIAPRR